MSFIADTLKRLIGDDTAFAFSQKVGVSQSALSRYLSGTSNVDKVMLERIVNALEKPQEKADLLEAWIREQLPESLRPDIEVHVGGTVNEAAPKRRLPNLPKETEDLLRYWWTEAAKDPAVGKLLATLKDLRSPK